MLPPYGLQRPDYRAGNAPPAPFYRGATGRAGLQLSKYFNEFYGYVRKQVLIAILGALRNIEVSGYVRPSMRTVLSFNALRMTHSDEALMAAAASIGDSNIPKTG